MRFRCILPSREASECPARRFEEAASVQSVAAGTPNRLRVQQSCLFRTVIAKGPRVKTAHPPRTRRAVRNRRVPSPVRAISTSLLVFLIYAASAAGQQRGDVVSIGMAKASVANARGLSALYSNPGALGLDALGRYDSLQEIELDIAVLPLGGVTGSTYMNSSELNFVFDKKDSGIFTDADRLRLASLLENGRLSADAVVDAFAIRIRAPRVGALGIRYGHRVRAQMTFPENFRTGVLGSGDVFASNQRFENPEIGGEWTRNLTFTFASAYERPIDDPRRSSWFPAFGIGFSLAYLEGIVHYDVDPSSWAATRVIPSRRGETYRSIEVNGYYRFRSSTPPDSTFNPSDAIVNSGIFSSKNAESTGWDGGFGLSLVILRKVAESTSTIIGNPLEAQQIAVGDGVTRDALLFGFAIDGIGSIRWNGTNRMREYSQIRDTLTDEKGGISNDVIYRYEAKLDTIGAFRTRLPMTLRTGLSADVTSFFPELPGDMIASLETAFDLNHEIGGERATRVSLGAEWRLTTLLTLRSGLQFGGRIGTALAFGVGLRPFSWLTIDASTAEVTSLFSPDRLRLDAAFTLATHMRF